jgi:hypothetical protein
MAGVAGAIPDISGGSKCAWTVGPDRPCRLWQRDYKIHGYDPKVFVEPLSWRGPVLALKVSRAAAAPALQGRPAPAEAVVMAFNNGSPS